MCIESALIIGNHDNVGIVQYVVLNDIHFPFESKVAYSRVLSRMQKLPNLKHIYLNGDIGEFESVSAHQKHPTANKFLSMEIDYVNKRFDQLQKLFPDVPVTLICGNHCYRIFRYIRDVAPEMWGLIDCPRLFRFEDRPLWKFIDYGPMQWVRCGKTHDLWLRHEPLGSGATHAKSTAEKSYVSVLYGHTHVYQQFTHKKMGPVPFVVTATSGGWLGDITKSCFDYRGSKDNWVTGFTEINCNEETGEYEFRFRAISPI